MPFPFPELHNFMLGSGCLMFKVNFDTTPQLSDDDSSVTTCSDCILTTKHMKNIKMCPASRPRPGHPARGQRDLRQEQAAHLPQPPGCRLPPHHRPHARQLRPERDDLHHR